MPHALGLYPYAFAAILAPTAAFACGGFFCSQTPVDQSAERIIFVQEDEETVSSYIEIQYQGDDDAFAWVIPVPAVPQVDVWTGQSFQALDLATQPIFQPPDDCQPMFAAAGGAGGGDSSGPPPSPTDEGVQVHLREQVGPFDVAVVESEDPRALVEWLRTNGYRIVEAMEPFIALYTAEGMMFTAMKLAPDQGVDAIEPVKLTYRSANPMVPLRLTSIAAVPEMGVKIWILGDRRYNPLNVPDVEVNLDDMVFRANTWPIESNYQALVARAVDAEDGKGFVTELAQPTDGLAQNIRDRGLPFEPDEQTVAAFDNLTALLDSKPYITRLYTRLSPAEMDRDPIFDAPAASDGDVSNVHDLSDRQGICGFGDEPDPCAFVACGAGGECFMAADENGTARPACACVDGAVARVMPDGQAPDGIGVACADRRLNFLVETSDQAETTPAVFADPCIGNSCGPNGRCASLNGTPTCDCDRGFVAVGRRADDGGAFTECIAPERPVPDEFYLRSLREPDLPFPGRQTRVGGGGGVGGSSGGCTMGRAPAAGGLILLVLTIAPLVLRRRRRQ